MYAKTARHAGKQPASQGRGGKRREDLWTREKVVVAEERGSKAELKMQRAGMPADRRGRTEQAEARQAGRQAGGKGVRQVSRQAGGLAKGIENGRRQTLAGDDAVARDAQGMQAGK